MSENKEGVQVATCTAEELLCTGGLRLPQRGDQDALEGRLCIPEYQRPYRWQSKQIQRLLADIEEHQKREKERLSRPREDGVKLAPIPYYLGSAILHRDTGGKLNIIDGQQRITTLALLGQVASKTRCDLVYNSPVSRRQIVRNLQWLGCANATSKVIKEICFDQLEFTLVITNSEDDAYAFFETQNTGGVRLSGPDIIKAHHLRAVTESRVDDFALRWEAMGDLNPVVGALLRGRYWRSVGPRKLPSHNKPMEIRTNIVNELAECTGTGDDIAYAQTIRTHQAGGAVSVYTPIVGYGLRQPLNSGVNTIHYLQFFEKLQRQYLMGPMPTTANTGKFAYFYHGLVCKLGGCGYLKQLYDACLLMYLSQFGEQHLYRASVKIFRVVYSRRVENRKAVLEQSVAAFVRDTPVLDWIAMSYTPEQCFSSFDGFELKVSEDGLKADTNGIKKRFLLEVQRYFELDVQAEDSTEKPGGSPAVDGQDFGQWFSEMVRTL